MQNIEDPRLLRDLCAAATRLPSGARIFERMNEALQNPDVDVHEIVAIINQDASLALRVMRLANSAQFVRGEQFTSLGGAIDWIGITQIYRIVASTVSAKIFCDNLSLYGITSEAMWKNAVATGTAMNLIADSAQMDPRRAYTLGLFRSVGRLILDKLAQQRQMRPGTAALPRSGDIINWEMNTLGINNAEAVGLLFSMWGLHPSIGECVRIHFNPLENTDSGQASRGALLHIGCWIAREAGFGLPIEVDAWRNTPEIMEQAKIPGLKLESFVQKTRDITARLTVNFSNN